jgi:Asp-tRNA(Asn)/Glu-tRNA(Gln) amidotransferase A subunit family amidase
VTEAASLGAREAATLIAKGELSVVELTQACLARIAKREPEVLAWSHFDPDAVLAQARACDARGPQPPLYGVPVGVKDIIDTADMPTAYGSPIYKGHRPKNDADCVARVRTAGGVVFGKTVTTEFAFRHPFGQTRNPHNPDRTPGGSSSGSAAAVADFMVPLAFGTQTGGSIIRPASYCGCYGYKPSFDTFSIAGVKPLAPALDTLGYFARNLDDIAWFGVALSSNLPSELTPWSGPAPRVGIARMYEWSEAEPATRRAVETAAARLAREGARVMESSVSEDFQSLSDIHRVIMNVEASRSLAWEREYHADQLSDTLRDILDRATKLSAEDYERALADARRFRARIQELFLGNDILLTASAPGEAPAGLAFTGSPAFNRVWTLLHVPCVTLPFGLGPNNLPVGVQLVGQPHDDARLLSAAAWVAGRLGL